MERKEQTKTCSRCGHRMWFQYKRNDGDKGQWICEWCGRVEDDLPFEMDYFKTNIIRILVDELVDIYCENCDNKETQRCDSCKRKMLNRKLLSDENCDRIACKIMMVQGHDNIQNLNLPTHSYNALRRGGIETIDELSKLSYQQLIAIRTIGVKSAKEICEKMTSIGCPIKGEN